MSNEIYAKTAGWAAFDVYCQNVGGTAYDGTAIPQWHALTRPVQLAWEAAAYTGGQWYAHYNGLHVVVAYDENKWAGIVAIKANEDEAKEAAARWSETAHEVDIEVWTIGDEAEVEP